MVTRVTSVASAVSAPTRVSGHLVGMVVISRGCHIPYASAVVGVHGLGVPVPIGMMHPVGGVMRRPDAAFAVVVQIEAVARGQDIRKRRAAA